MESFQPTHIRYIKLGQGGEWEKRCILEDNTIMLGYENPHHEEALAGSWESVRRYWLKERNGSQQTAKNDLRQIRDFYEMPESCLWITFYSRYLYWCFSESQISELPDGIRVRKIIDKWSNKSLSGHLLGVENIDGRVTRTQGYRGTICSFEMEEYLIRKIRGDEQPEVQSALNDYAALKTSLEELIRGLWWRDFELLTDLIFAQSGWQRISVLGKTEKSIDIDILSPVRGKRAFVQVKSRASMNDLQQSISEFRNMDQYDEMYFVVHTTTESVANHWKPDVNVIDISSLAELVIRAGLVNWLIKKRS